jgi:hypothetical protein
MKRVRIRSAEELDALPEGEWVEVVGGMNVRFIDETLRPQKDKLVVPLSKAAAAQFAPRRGERLTARVSKGKLIVERHGPTRRRSRPRKRAA